MQVIYNYQKLIVQYFTGCNLKRYWLSFL